MSEQFDAIIIGTGQAGPPLANRLTNAGMRVAIMERGLFGGTCVNTGCIPTKAMVASAYAANLARRGSEFGVSIPGAVSVDMKKVKARKDGISAASRSGVESWLDGMKNCTVLRGHARFESAHEVRLGGELYSAGKIFINVGGRAYIPPIPGLEDIEYFTNSSMMGVDFLPAHLVIVGGSYIGLEFGQMFRRFGSEVTILEGSDRLISREDPDISASVRSILENEKIAIHVNAHAKRVEKSGADLVVKAEVNGKPVEIHGSHLLLGVGRIPNTDDLGLERAGVEVNKSGYIVVNDELQTNVSGIWALGDCNGRGAFTHTSYNDFEIVAANLLDNDHRRVSDRITAYALYIDPPLGRAGMTQEQAAKVSKNILVGQRPMTRVGRAVEKGETQGFMKIVVDGDSRKILGAAVLGTGGDEVIHSILDVMYSGSPYTLIQRAMHIHPTVSELVPTMLGELKPATESPEEA